MGKRKERRLAAMMASGRRVKLDISADPSGDMADSPLDEGGDPDQDHQAGGLNSPSASGGKQENPLLLLGQYSDDELDEETGKQKVEVLEGSPQIELDDKVKQTEVADLAMGSNTAVDSDIADTKSCQQLATAKSLNGVHVEESSAAMAVQYSGTDVTDQNGVDASGMPIVGDLSGGWRVVMHEESNQYYYWNTLTGETSWVMPEGLTSESGTGIKTDSCATNEVKVDCTAVFQGHLDPETETYPNVSHSNGHTTSELPGTTEHSSLLVVHSLSNNEAKLEEQSSGSYGTTNFHFAQLIVYGQNLLERSKALKGSVNCPEGIELILKEIEVRLTDCQTLLSYGSSLLPFWWHTENQLKQLETVIVMAEASSVDQKTSLNEENIPEISKASETNDSSPGYNHTSPANPTTMKDEADTMKLEEKEQSLNVIASKSISKNLEASSLPETSIELEPDVITTNLASKVVDYTAEEVDMDVEMEIDDVAVASCSTTQHTVCSPSLEQLIQPTASPIERLPVPVESDIPPPPDEEWIPPPPPDCEPVPPPPPEEPPIADPPTYADSVTVTYQEPYASGYVLPTYSYFAPAIAEVTSSTYYVPNDGSYTGDAQNQSYYEPVVAVGLPEVAATDSADPVGYYDASAVVATNGTVGTSVELPDYYIASGPVNYTITATAKQTNPIQKNLESDNTSVPSRKHSSSSRVVSSSYVHSNNSSEEESGTTTKGDATTAPIPVSKGQSKVSRSKKRAIAVAPTLRSNKKVSSLLDKWMAAKEELHGEEDEEPLDAYELLEKKRKKEIEQWHASQIASGQAHENANFQPLGGDWRERVKRRRAEAAKSKSIKPIESIENDKKRPDLTELSKTLPSGWQAYWDESSKEVYYANSITSETTWERPMR